MDSDWTDAVPEHAWATADTYAEWLQKGTWTINEATFLFLALRPVRELLNGEDAPIAEARRIVDFLWSHAGTEALCLVNPNDHEFEHRFPVKELLNLAVTHEAALPRPLPEALRSAWSDMQPATDRRTRQWHDHEQRYRAAIKVLANYHDECSTKPNTVGQKGHVMGAAVARLIIDHIDILMPEKTDRQPPQGVARMAMLINEALGMGAELPDKPRNFKIKR